MVGFPFKKWKLESFTSSFGCGKNASRGLTSPIFFTQGSIPLKGHQLHHESLYATTGDQP